jgi:hypothetical protein
MSIEPHPIDLDKADKLLADAARDAFTEAATATRNWPPMNSAHEAFAILLEEVEELKEHVFMNQRNRVLSNMRSEAIQVAAVALRFASECCNEKVGRK